MCHRDICEIFLRRSSDSRATRVERKITSSELCIENGCKLVIVKTTTRLAINKPLLGITRRACFSSMGPFHLPARRPSIQHGEEFWRNTFAERGARSIQINWEGFKASRGIQGMQDLILEIASKSFTEVSPYRIIEFTRFTKSHSCTGYPTGNVRGTVLRIIYVASFNQICHARDRLMANILTVIRIKYVRNPFARDR